MRREDKKIKKNDKRRQESKTVKMLKNRETEEKN